MAEEIAPFQPENFNDAITQLQQLIDDIYYNRIAGAYVGDVFEIDNQSDILTLNVANAKGLDKTSGQLGVKADPSGPVSLTASGVDVSLASPTKKGAAPQLPSDATKFLNGIGAWTVPIGSQAFPVGAYYFNSTGVNPGIELGYGTWVQVAKNLTLVGAP